MIQIKSDVSKLDFKINEIKISVDYINQSNNELLKHKNDINNDITNSKSDNEINEIKSEIISQKSKINEI